MAWVSLSLIGDDHRPYLAFAFSPARSMQLYQSCCMWLFGFLRVYLWISTCCRGFAFALEALLLCALAHLGRCFGFMLRREIEPVARLCVSLHAS